MWGIFEGGRTGRAAVVRVMVERRDIRVTDEFMSIRSIVIFERVVGSDGGGIEILVV